MSPIQQRTTYPTWMTLEGTTLDDAYLLGQCLGADERKITFKARVKTGHPAAAIVRLYRPQSNTATAAEEQVAVWEAIKSIKHPNLMAILGTGRTKLGQEQVIYLAIESPDEMLDKVLLERPLDTVEAGELVVSICRGLERLHEAGFVHGSLSPEEVFGVGDSVKLSTEGVRRAGSAPGLEIKDAKYRAPESVNGNVNSETDVWCFGATLFEAMTQKECGADCRSDAAKLPPPFGSIVHRCLYNNPEARCTLPEIVQLYERRPRAFTAAAGAGAGWAIGDPHDAENSSAAPEPLQSEPQEALPERSAQTQPRHSVPGSVSTSARPQRRTWAILAISLLVVAALIWLARPRKPAQRGSVTNPAVNKAAPVRQTAVPVPSVAPAQIPAPPKTAATISSAHEPPAAQATQYVNGPIWRVVIYTYDTAANAENRAQVINGKHPNLKAEVFSPNGTAGPFLVTIGGQMSRDDAVALRQRVLRLGLPRDTYLQNYKQ